MAQASVIFLVSVQHGAEVATSFYSGYFSHEIKIADSFVYPRPDVMLHGIDIH